MGEFKFEEKIQVLGENTKMKTQFVVENFIFKKIQVLGEN